MLTVTVIRRLVGQNNFPAQVLSFLPRFFFNHLLNTTVDVVYTVSAFSVTSVGVEELGRHNYA